MIAAPSLLLTLAASLAAGPTPAPGPDAAEAPQLWVPPFQAPDHAPAARGSDGAALVGPDGRHHRLDAPVPPPPTDLRAAPVQPQARDLGTPTTIFVNFDGITLASCTPSNSKKNCHWYNTEKPIPPFSGTIQTKVSVVQAMRRDVIDFGVRVTGLRPPDSERYTMVIYGGTEAEYGALGSAPSGDCDDQNADEIAFAHLDGELVEWINGGATTALHEAAHTWGLDHIDAEHTVMYPSADNTPTAFRSECEQLVGDVELTPIDAEAISCPDINQEMCGRTDAQHGRMLIERMFGGPYVDSTPPTITLLEPRDGTYFQAPADFDVLMEIRDDLHPQVYQVAFWLGDDPKPEPRPFIEDHFSVSALPVGTWEFHVEFADAAGNATRLDFEIEVGEDPPPEPSTDDRGCRIGRFGGPGGVSGPAGFVVLLLPLLAGRRRSR